MKSIVYASKCRTRVVRYEDLKENPQLELSRLLEFVFVGKFSASASIIDEAIRYSSMENMAKYEAENKFCSSILSNPGAELAAKVRQGKVGGYRVELDVALQEWCDKQMADLDARYGYE